MIQNVVLMSGEQTMCCKICGNAKSNKAYVAKEMMIGIGDKHEYFQCASCECLQLVKIPRNLSDYYPVNYYAYSKKILQKELKSI